MNRWVIKVNTKKKKKKITKGRIVNFFKECFGIFEPINILHLESMISAESRYHIQSEPSQLYSYIQYCNHKNIDILKLAQKAVNELLDECPNTN